MVKDAAALTATATTSKDDENEDCNGDCKASRKLTAYSRAFYVECILLMCFFSNFFSI